MKTKYIVTTVHEAFPVFFSHASYPEEHHRGTAKGPFYAPGSKRYCLATEKNLKHAEFAASILRERGWTVSVTEEVR